jgi:DNA-binding MarR family transcriptional regulator
LEEDYESMDKINDEFIQNYMDSMNIDVLYVEMNRAEHKLLKMIEKLENKYNDVVYLATLAEEMNVPVVNASKAVKLLSEKGYIIWAMDNEKKNTTVVLSPNGKKLLALQDKRLYSVLNEVFSELDETEQSLLKKIISKLDKIIDENYSLKADIVEA